MTGALTSTRQDFDTYDALQVFIERDPVTGELLNLLPNPDGTLGTWGWITPVSRSALTVAGDVFTLTTGLAQHVYASSDYTEVTPGRYVNAAWEMTGHVNMALHRAVFEWYSADHTLIDQSDVTGFQSSTAGTRYSAAPVPAGAAYTRFRLDPWAGSNNPVTPAGASMSFRRPRVVESAAPMVALNTNMIGNPRFAANLDGWSAFSPDVPIISWPTLDRVADATMGGVAARLTNQSSDAAGNIVTQQGWAQPVVAGHAYTVSFDVRSSASRAIQAIISWDNGAPDTVIGLTASSTATTRRTATFTAPGGSTYGTFGIKVAEPANVVGETHFFGRFKWEPGNVATAYSEGVTVVSGDVPYCPAAYYTDVHTHADVSYGEGPYGDGPYGTEGAYTLAGSLSGFDIKRVAGPDASGATLTFVDGNLDPATSPLLQPGRKIILSTRPGSVYGDGPYGEGPYGFGAWATIFTSTIKRSVATYALDKGILKPAIAITTNDNAARLAATDQGLGVGTIAELPEVIEPAGVPWNCDGNTSQVLNVAQVSADTSAKVLDQIHATRDTRLAQAWIDAHGVVVVRSTPDPTVKATLGEGDYNTNIVIEHDTDRCINLVKIILKTIVDGEDVETTYGPYADNGSIRRWDPHPATFTVHGLAPAALPAYAAQVLASSAEPIRCITSIQIPMTMATLRYALLDLGDLIEVTNEATSITGQRSRIDSINHTADAGTWFLTLGLVLDGRAAIPTAS